MRAYILNSAENSDVSTTARRVENVLSNRGWNVDRLDVAESDIGRCIVCGACGEKTPGVCVLKDAGQDLVANTAEVDLMVLVSPVCFGGYSATLKRAFERTMPNIHPEFCISHGELHHKWRYEHSPSLLTVGHLREGDTVAAGLFAHLAQRGAINYLSRTYASTVIVGEPESTAADAAVAGAVDEIEAQTWKTQPTPETAPLAEPAGRRVCIIGASGRRKSNSRAIGDYFGERLEAEGFAVRRIDLAPRGLIDGDLSSILDDLEWAEIVQLISPLYHDTLTYPAMRLLEFLYTCRKETQQNESERLPQFGAFIHSGYPESVNSRNALGICRHFASTMGWPWIGGFSAGVTSPIDGKPLPEAGFFSRRLRRALDDAARRLASGHGPPAPVRPPLPKAFFALAGNTIVRKGLPNDIDIDARPYAGLFR